MRKTVIITLILSALFGLLFALTSDKPCNGQCDYHHKTAKAGIECSKAYHDRIFHNDNKGGEDV